MKSHFGPTFHKHFRSYKRVSTFLAALVVVGVMTAVFLTMSVLSAPAVTPGFGFNLDGQGIGIYSTRPTGADFSTGTGEAVLQIVTHASDGTAIDYDGDGNREIVVQTVGNSATVGTQTRLYIFEAEGNNDFRQRATVLIDQGTNGSSPGLLRGVDVGNVDGDAALEIVSASGSGSSTFLTVYDVNIATFALSEIVQTQIFGASGLFTTNGTINQVRILPNKNGGTNNDILLSNATNATTTYLFAVEYNGAATVFVNTTAANSGITVNSGVIGFDHGNFGDASDEEIVMVTEVAGSALVIREYVASATAPFGTAKTITTNWTGTTTGSFTTIAVGDLDGDGDLDGVATDYNNKFVQAVRRTGVDTYTSQPIFSGALAAFPPAAEISDFDNDGRREVVYSNGTSVVYREHDGTIDSFASGNFGSELNLLTGLSTGTANAISFVGGSSTTLDNDKNFDFVVGRSVQVSDTDMDADELFFLEADRSFSTGAIPAGSYDNLEITGNTSLSGATTVRGTLTLTSGILTTANLLSMASGSAISRSDGEMTGTPQGAGTYDVTYTGVLKQTGPELSGAGLTNVTVVMNPSQLLVLDQSRTIPGTLTLTNGMVQTGPSFTLIIGPAGTVVRTNGLVIGNLQKTFTATGSKTFEVGTGQLSYSPVDVNATAGTFPATFAVRAIQGQMPQISGTNALQRYWTLTSPGVLTANLTFNYLAGDVVGTAANYKFIKNSGGTLTTLNPDAPPTNTTATISGVSSFSDWTLAETGAVQSGSLQFSTANYTDSETNADHTFNVPVTRTGGSDGAVSVNYDVTDGTATTADNDYAISPASGTLNWAAGDATIKNIPITVKGDTTFEPDEDVNIAITSPGGGASLGTPNTAVLTITNDDAACTPPSTVYVDDDWVGTTLGDDPDMGGPATNFGCDSFATIQGGVNGVTSAGTVIVRPGTYAEAILINKSLTLQGAQSGQNVNTRFAAFTLGPDGVKADPLVESVITAAATAPASGANDTLHVMADNVTIDGFTVDGNNPALAQGGATVVGGINTDSRRGIQTEDAAGTPFAASNTQVQNNIIQNFAQRCVELINGTASNTAPATGGSLINLNLIRNFGVDGIVLAFNAHADITNNTIRSGDYPNVEAGIWIQDFLNVGPSIPVNITNNNITVGQDNFGGIWVNLAYLPDLNINNNDVSAEAGVTGASDFTFGIYLSSQRPGSDASLSGNVVGLSGGQFARGIALWNLGSATPTTVTGGTIGNSLKGLSLHDNDPNFGLAGANSVVNTSGVSISGVGVTGAVGIFVDAAGSTGDTVAMEISGNTSVSDTATGIAVVGANASANIHNNAASITDNTVGIDVNAASATITSNNIYANGTSLRFTNAGTAIAHFNRIISTTTAIDNPNNATPNLENNWWGCNAGPGNTGCGAVTGTGADFDPWIVLGVSATPQAIPPGGMSTITADMTKNSDGATPAGTLPDMPVAWSATNGTMNPTSGTVTAGQAMSTFTSTTNSNGMACAMVDNQQICATVTIGPTAAAVRVSGQIVTAEGLPLGGATVTVTGGSGTIIVITDGNGFYKVENLEAGGFYTVTPSRANFMFAPESRSFSLVADKTDAVFTATGVAANGNPLENPEFFVRQQYLDFLGREPEQSGLAYWSGQLRACGSDRECISQRRLEVSAAFFIAQEFQESGLFIYDLYQGAFARRPAYAEYSVDRRRVVGGPRLEADKAAFASSFVERAEFQQLYPLTQSDEVYVDALLQRAEQSSGLDLSRSRAALIALYNSGTTVTESRGLVLRSVVEGAQFQQTQYNAAFVLAEYFGYLGRNPDPDGYDFWLNVLNSGERNNYRGMVCSFITSAEYQQRFSPVVTRNNAECR